MRMRQAFIAVAAAFAIAACGDGTTDIDDNATVAGTYRLQTVNGDSLPFLLAELGGERLEVESGVIILRKDMTFTDSLTFLYTETGMPDDREHEVATGTYAQNNNAITFTPSSGSVYAASHTGTTLTQTIESFVLVYRK